MQENQPVNTTIPGWDKFLKVYNGLNTAQQKAVDTIEGPVLVVAGPGTGKTQVLSARIANILRLTDTTPQNILALTFTESAAKNMQERIVSMIGKPGFYVEITTFHSFCTSVINSYPEYFPVDRDSQPITDVERYDIFKQVIRELPLETLKPLNTPYFYLKDAVRAISELKREGVTSEQFINQVSDFFADHNKPEKKVALQQFLKQKAKNEELQQIYISYQKKLRERRRYDFDDMIAFVVEAFRTEKSLLLEYQEKFLYFLVDEYQDTNSAQNEVVNLLASHWEDQANVFVVGDPHQSIYRFQGASTENVVGFATYYANAQVITLSKNYRSPQELVAVAHSLIQQSSLAQFESIATAAGKTLTQAMTQPLTAQKKRTDAVEIWSAPSQTVELIQVAESIKKLLASGVLPEDIAILYRTNKEVTELSEVLEKWGIKYEIDGGSNVFEFEPIQQLLQLFTVIDLYKSDTEDERIFEVLCYPWLKLDTLSVYHLTHLSGKKKKSIRQLIELGYQGLLEIDPNCIAEKDYTKIASLMEKIKHWAVLDAQLSFPAWFERVISESGYLDWIKAQPSLTELLLYLNTLFEQVKRFAKSKANFKLHDLLESILVMREYGIALVVQDLNITQGAVHVSTVHKAKGREWPYVYILHCIDGVWGNTRERNMIPLPSGLLKHTAVDKAERNEDDRRLLYVALTRAKEKCWICYPETFILENRVKSTVASMFIQEIQEKHPELTAVEQTDVIEQQAAYLERLVGPRPTVVYDERRQQFFKNIVANYKLSVSALNKYLNDPASFVLTNLLLIPSAQAPYLSFGTAMHAALEVLVKQVLQGSSVEPEKVYQHFQKTLQAELLSEEDFERRLQYGKQVLENYMRELAASPILPWQLELRFGDGVRKAFLDDIPLVGRIDRFDWVDQEKKLVRVIDYKTGAPKTRGALEGTTASAGLSERELALPESIRSPFKRQLLFYKLLTQADHSFVPKVVEGVFEFVEPDKRTGKITRHQFPLPDSEVAELSDLIRTVMQELRELRFLEFIPQLTSTVEVENKQNQ